MKLEYKDIVEACAEWAHKRGLVKENIWVQLEVTTLDGTGRLEAIVRDMTPEELAANPRPIIKQVPTPYARDERG